MNIKRLISIILSISLLLPTIPMLVAAAPKTTLEVGDIIFVGSYGGSPVEYKVMGTKDIDSDGQGEFYLASTKIIAFLRLHQWGGSTAGPNWSAISGTVPSNLRTWLNSKDANVDYGTNATHQPVYKSYAGFMSGMSNEEYEAIVPVKNKTLVPINTAAGYTGGTVAPIEKYDEWPQSYNAQTSYSNVYWAESEDRVFVPSIEELYTFFGTTADALKANMNVPVIGDLSAEYNANKSDSIAYSWHSSRYSTWLRDNIDATTSGNQRLSVYIYNNNKPIISAANAAAARGVRPCMYLDDDTVIEDMPGNPGKYRIQPDVSIDVAVKQNAVDVTAISSGEIAVSGSFSVKNDEGKLVAALYHVAGGKEIMEDYAEAVEGTVNITLTASSDGDRYVKVYGLSSTGKLLEDPIVKGCASPVTFSAAETAADSLTVDTPVISGKNITLQGTAAASAKDLKIVVESDVNTGVIAYSNEFKLGAPKRFTVPLSIEKLFGTGAPANVTGRYNIKITSGETTVTEPFAYVAPETWSDVILSNINSISSENNDYETKLSELVDTFANIYPYDLNHSAITDKGFYLDLPATTVDVKAALLAVIAARPLGGYSDAAGVVSVYNPAILSEVFKNTDIDKKYSIIEHDIYKTLLHSEEVIGDADYASVKAGAKRADLFNGVTVDNFASKAYENFISIVLNTKEDYNDAKAVIEKYAGKIGITFGSDYSSLTSGETKTLYDAFLTGTIASYDEIKTIYTTTLAKIIANRNKGGSGTPSGRPSAGTVGGSSGLPSVGGNISNAPEPNVPQYKSFPDIESLTWGKEEIDYLVKEGIFSGDDKGNFNPDDDITREQFAKISALAFDIDEAYGAGFGDVDANAWYAPFVSALAKTGAMQGTPDGDFGVGKSITRQDVAVVIARLLGKGSESYDGEKFADYELIADYARDAVMILSDMGIINGKDGNMFDPLSPITRREAAMIIYRLIGGAK